MPCVGSSADRCRSEPRARCTRLCAAGGTPAGCQHGRGRRHRRCRRIRRRRPVAFGRRLRIGSRHGSPDRFGGRFQPAGPGSPIAAAIEPGGRRGGRARRRLLARAGVVPGRPWLYRQLAVKTKPMKTRARLRSPCDRARLLAMALAWGLPALVAMAAASATAQEPHARPQGHSEGHPAAHAAEPSVPGSRGSAPPSVSAPRAASRPPSSTIPSSPPPNSPRTATARPPGDGRGQVLDARYNHGRYYPPVGTVTRSLPADYRPYYRGGRRYYFHGGVWYAPRDGGFIVVRPPVGLVIAVLPLYCSTVWFGGVPYYYANNLYYTAQPDQSGYAIVDPPDNADAYAAPADGGDAAPGQAPQDQLGDSDFIIYPRNGQSKDQQAA